MLPRSPLHSFRKASLSFPLIFQELHETHKKALKDAGVPPCPKGFAPRDHAWRVRGALMEKGEQVCVVVRGPGGAGKTTLLIDALRVRTAFPFFALEREVFVQSILEVIPDSATPKIYQESRYSFCNRGLRNSQS